MADGRAMAAVVCAAVMVLPRGSRCEVANGQAREFGRKEHASCSLFVSKRQCRIEASAEGKLKVTTLSKSMPTLIIRGNKKIAVKPSKSHDVEFGDEIGLQGAVPEGLIKVLAPDKPKAAHFSSSSEQKPAKKMQNTTKSIQKNWLKSSKPRWRSIGTSLIVNETGRPCTNIASFDFDGTLVDTKTGTMAKQKSDYVFPDQDMIEKLKNLSNEYQLVIFTNQNGIKKAHGGKRAERVKWAIEEAMKKIGVPIDVYIATTKDKYRKGIGIGMWEQLEKTMRRRGSSVNKSKSFFVGDAAGRYADFSNSDKVFAESAGVKFMTREDFFGTPKPSRLPGMVLLERMKKIMEESKGKMEREKLMSRSYPGTCLVILCGPQGAGKSTFSQLVMRAALSGAWTYVNQDSIRNGKQGTRTMCEKAAREGLRQGSSVLIDRMHLQPEQRSWFIKIAREFGIPCHCVVFYPPADLCANRVRNRKNHPTLQGPRGAMMARRSHSMLMPPQYSEGFSLISVCEDNTSANRLGQYYSLLRARTHQNKQSTMPTKKSSEKENSTLLPESLEGTQTQRHSLTRKRSKEKSSEKNSKREVTRNMASTPLETLNSALPESMESYESQSQGGEAPKSEKKVRTSINLARATASARMKKRKNDDSNTSSTSLAVSKHPRLTHDQKMTEEEKRKKQMEADELLARNLAAEWGSTSTTNGPKEKPVRNSISLIDDEEEDMTASTNSKAGKSSNYSDGTFLGKFRLLKVHKNHGLPSSANEMSVGLRDMVAAGRRPEWAMIINYMIDFNYVIHEWPELMEIPKVIVFHGQKVVGRVRFPSNMEVYEMSPEQLHRIPYGVHHTKSFILGFKDSIRIVVHTANLISCDFNNKSQGAWIQEFPLKAKKEGKLNTSTSTFEEDLLTYMKSYEIKWKGSKWQDHRANKSCSFSVNQLRNYDYSKANVRLIASVPGRHYGRALNTYGHLKLKSILQKEEFPAKFSNSNIVLQFSSMGSLNSKWIEKFRSSLSAGKAKDQKGNLGLGKLQVIWPTVDEVRQSLDGYAAGGSIPCKEKNIVKPMIPPLLHKWATDTVHSRRKVPPHIKTFLRYAGEDCQSLAWILLTSHNLSQAAWGVQQNGKRGLQLFIRNWELGVLFLPSLQKGYASQPELCTTSRPPSKNSIRFPLPYALPPTKYKSTDVAWRWTDKPFPTPDRFGRYNA